LRSEGSSGNKKMRRLIEQRARRGKAYLVLIRKEVVGTSERERKEEMLRTAVERRNYEKTEENHLIVSRRCAKMGKGQQKK
jgi:hypothetical protein